MYLVAVILLLAVFPAISIGIEFGFASDGDLLILVGKWFVFWAVGIRLLLAGLRQIANPSYTAKTFFDLDEPKSLVIVRELGIANAAIGFTASLTLFKPEWVVSSAIVGGVFYGLAGVNHLLRGHRNTAENIATISDLLMFAVLAGYVLATLWRLL